MCTDCLSEASTSTALQCCAPLRPRGTLPVTKQREGTRRSFRASRLSAGGHLLRHRQPIDRVILRVLIRPKSIKSDLGVTVAVPGSSETDRGGTIEGALFRESRLVWRNANARSTSSRSGTKEEGYSFRVGSARDQEKASGRLLSTPESRRLPRSCATCGPRSVVARMSRFSGAPSGKRASGQGSRP